MCKNLINNYKYNLQIKNGINILKLLSIGNYVNHFEENIKKHIHTFVNMKFFFTIYTIFEISITC